MNIWRLFSAESRTQSDLEEDLKRNLDWIRSADQKASIVLALFLGAASLVAPKYIDFVRQKASEIDDVTSVILIPGIVFLLISISALVDVLLPFTKLKGKSLIYFGTVAKMTKGEYLEAATSVTADSRIQDLAHQVHVTAKRCSAKHNLIKTAIYSAGIGTALLALALFTLL